LGATEFDEKMGQKKKS
jgi:hypothetical protein